MSEMEYGSDEHLDGLSRDALKAEVRWWHGRALEMEAENAKLRELVRIMTTYCVNGYCGKDDGCPLRLTDYDCQLLTKASGLGVEV